MGYVFDWKLFEKSKSATRKSKFCYLEVQKCENLRDNRVFGFFRLFFTFNCILRNITYENGLKSSDIFVKFSAESNFGSILAEKISSHRANDSFIEENKDFFSFFDCWSRKSKIYKKCHRSFWSSCKNASIKKKFF